VSSPVLSFATNVGSSGNIVLNGNVGSTGGSTSLSVDGSGAISQSAGTLLGSTVNLTATNGSIGTVAAPFRTAATNLAAHTGGSGNVYLSNTGDLTLGDSSAGMNFQLVTAGSLTVNNLSTNNGSI